MSLAHKKTVRDYSILVEMALMALRRFLMGMGETSYGGFLEQFSAY